MKIFIGADHAGYSLKEALKKHLELIGHTVEDKGAYSHDEEDDYPDFIFPVAQAVLDNPESRGVIIGGSGQGEAMAANRVKGARAAVFYGGNLDIIKLSRQHNNANILSLGARFITGEEATAALDLWLSTDFEGGRHVRRIEKLDK